jgi:tetratricopeptide (TPR) repeat protein
MIKDVAKDLIRKFGINRFVEPGTGDIGTAEIVTTWFKELHGAGEVTSGSVISGADVLKGFCDSAAYCHNSMFYLNGTCEEHASLHDEIMELLKLKKSIILIDNFYTPGKPFKYSAYKGKRLDVNYIRDLIGERAKDIYYAAIANGDNRGMAVLFIGYGEGELQAGLNGLPLIREDLADGKLSLMGRSGRVLLMGVGQHRVRTMIPTLCFENYVDNCMSGYEIITFGYNEGVDIRIDAGDDFSRIVNALPNGWMPDLCIFAGLEYGLPLPKGIEKAPCLTVYLSFDWDYHIHTTRTFVQAVDLTVHDGDFSVTTLNAMGANNIERFYASGVRKEFFDPAPRKMADRKYDILYATSVNDARLPDRSAWILKLCELADRYKVHIVQHAGYHSYLELLKDARLTFSYTKLGEMSPRIHDAASQGAVTMDPGHAVKKYFQPDEEYIPVTYENIEEQVKKYLDDETELQRMSDRVYAKTLEKYEPRLLFVKFLEKLYGHLDNNDRTLHRRFGNLSKEKRCTRWGELYYFSFWISVDKWGWLNNHKNLLQMSIEEFRKAVEAKQTPGGMLNLAIAEASQYFYFHRDEPDKVKINDIIAGFERVIAAYPTHAAAYFNLGLVHLRAGHHDSAINMFLKAQTLFMDIRSYIDPWCLYNTTFDPDFKTSFDIGKPLNACLLSLCRGNEHEAISGIRKLYQAATLYYLATLHEKKGQIDECINALLKSHELYPESVLTALEAAKKLVIFNQREKGLAMYRKAIKLLPFNIDLRIEFIKLLYLYKMDREALKEINSILTIIKKTEIFRDKAVILNKILEDLDRFNDSAFYSHDLCRENVLNSFIEVLYSYLERDPANTALIMRIAEVWDELGRADKILELMENFFSLNRREDISDKDISILKEIYAYLSKLCALSEITFNERLDKLSGAVSDMQTSLNLKIGTLI